MFSLISNYLLTSLDHIKDNKYKKNKSKLTKSQKLFRLKLLDFLQGFLLDFTIQISKLETLKLKGKPILANYKLILKIAKFNQN